MATDFGSSGGGQFTDLLMALLGGGDGKGGGDVLDFIKQGSKSPLLKQILNATLAALVPGEQQARQSLTDQFRAAGGLRSGAYGREGTLLEGELAGKRGLATAGVMGSTLSPILQALTSQQGQQFDLIKMLMSLQNRGGGSGWENIPPSMGLQTPMTTGGGGAAPSPTPSAPNQTLNLDQLLERLRGGGGITPSYAPAGLGRQTGPDWSQNTNTVISDVAAPVDPWAELVATDWGYLNP